MAPFVPLAPRPGLAPAPRVAARAEDLQLEGRAPATVHELLELDTTIPDDRASVGEQEMLEVKLTQQAVERVEQMSLGNGRVIQERVRDKAERAGLPLWTSAHNAIGDHDRSL